MFNKTDSIVSDVDFNLRHFIVYNNKCLIIESLTLSTENLTTTKLLSAY